MSKPKVLLISCKIVSSVSDATREEITYYKKFISNYWDIPIADFSDCMLFDVDNEEFATDELRVRRWDWNGHEILDINSWPGDNETGVVVQNGRVIATNSDQFLTQVSNSDIDLNFFSDLRIILIADEKDIKSRTLDHSAESIDWRLSKNGKISHKIEEAAQELYMKQF